MKDRNIISFGVTAIFFAILFGAFGAHGLKAYIESEKLVTFEVGVRYQMYHGLALILLGIIQKNYLIDMRNVAMSFLGGILLFSFNCYFYVLSSVKIFAMIVPLGGLLYLLGWLM